MSAKRKAEFDVEITEGSIRVRHRDRVLTITRAAGPPNAENPADFLVYLDDLVYWDAPHDQVEVDIKDLQQIVAAIEVEFDRHGLTVEFD